MDDMDVDDVNESYSELPQDEEEEEKAEVREEYRKLNEEICRQEDGILDSINLTQLIHKNDKLYEKVKTVQQSVTDARLIRGISRLCRKQTDEMSANAVQFRYQEYAERLVRKIKGTISEDGTAIINRRKLILLGTQAKPLFNRSPVLTYMKGALSQLPPARKEKKVREAKKKPEKSGELKSTQAVVVDKTENTGTQTEQMVVHTLSCLVNIYKQNQRKPLNYFRFVTDPSCFGKSIENMFHVSFLVKEGKAKIFLENGLAVIKPVKPKRAGHSAAAREDDVKNQIVMNMTMYDWERMVSVLNLDTPMIPSLESLRAPSSPQPGPSTHRS